MRSTVDHFVYACPDLDRAVAEVEATVGVRAVAGGRHPDLGTANALLSLGPATYLELIGPDPSAGPRDEFPYGLHTLARPALRAWAVAPDDFDEAIARLETIGEDLGPARRARRETTDGRELSWRMTPAGGDADVEIRPFLIEWGETPHPAVSSPAGLSLRRLVVSSPEVSRLQRLFATLGLDIEVQEALRPGLRVVIATAGDHELVLES